MDKCIYWQSDGLKNYIVRQKGGLFEDYKKGRGWMENANRFDIISGIDPYYTEISEKEALKIINNIKNDM